MAETPQEKGGRARADALTATERRDIARQAALARWDKNVPQATHEGNVRVSGAVVGAAVLPNGLRILTQATFLRALGRARSPKAGTGVLTTVDQTPFFLQAEALKPFISEDLAMSTTPVFFRTLNGKKAVGYDARLLPRVAKVYLAYRDSLAAEGKPIPTQHKHIVKACDALIQGLAEVGIIAMVDEATGFEKVRDRDALQAILDQYLRKEFAAWAKRFPDEFYEEIFRLRGWKKGTGVRRPHAVAHYTNDLVYARLAAGVFSELQRRNPKDERGVRRSKFHQWLTEDVGHPRLAEHLYGVIGLMRANDDWDVFMGQMNRAYPVRGDQLELPFVSPSVARMRPSEEMVALPASLVEVSTR